MTVMAARGGSLIGGAFTLLGMAAFMGPPEYGRYVVCVGTATVLAQIAKWGLDGLAVRQLARSHDNDREASRHYCAWAFTQLAMRSAILILCVVIVSSSASWLGLGQVIFDTLLPAGILAVPTAAGALLQGILRGQGKIRSAEVFEGVFKPISVLAVCSVWVLLVSEPVSFSVALTALLSISVMATALASLVALGPYFEKRALILKAPQELTGMWRREAWQHGGMNFFQVILSRAPVLVAGSILPPTQVAIFAVALRIADLIQFVPITIGISLAPQASRLHHAADPLGLTLLYRRSRILSLVGSSLASAFVFLGFPAILFIIGSNYRDSYLLIGVLVVFQIASSLAGPMGYFVSMMGRQVDAMIVNALASTVLIICLFSLGSKFGLIPLTIAIGATNLAVCIALMKVFEKEISRMASHEC